MVHGISGAYLKDAKIHGELSKYYWWPKMRADSFKWCHSCLVCHVCSWESCVATIDSNI